MIYIVEDDDSIRELVIYTLQTSGWEAAGFSCAEKFWEAIKMKMPQLVILDIMLPDEDGLTILKKLRRMPGTGPLPVMMLTARSSEYDKVVGLDGGADDYLAKPFGMMEFIARVKALLRRSESNAVKTPGRYEMGSLTVDIERHSVYVNGNAVTLAHKEFELLCCLIRNRGLVLSREQLLSRVWGYDFDGETRTVDVHIRTLRQKLMDAGNLIETIRGVGYKIGE